MDEATGRIKIVKVPSGSAPEWVRQAWVGLILPCYPIMGLPDNGEPEKDIRDGHSIKYNGLNRRSISVPQTEALRILSKAKLGAATWWKSQGFPKQTPNDCFSFGEDEVQIVSGVSQQRLRQYLGILEIGR